MNCQRWKTRRESWRPSGEIFNPSRHEVAEIDELTAKRFVIEHHYSASYPAARFRVGLFRSGCELAGVAVFSHPMQGAAIPKYTGLHERAGVELGRFVLLDEVEANGESWFLGRAFALLRDSRHEIRGVISYSDPVPRHDAQGRTITPGHVGTIYQAHNGRYCGRAASRRLTLTRDGRVISPRALSKIRNDEQGAAYSYQLLRSNGAPPRRMFESGAEYVTRALAEGPFRRILHPGNHAYAWPIGSPAQRRALLEQFAPSYSYPKRAP
jgi:hypothetical protein